MPARVKEIHFSRLFEMEGYNNAKVGFTVELSEGDDPASVYCDLQECVHGLNPKPLQAAMSRFRSELDINGDQWGIKPGTNPDAVIAVLNEWKDRNGESDGSARKRLREAAQRVLDACENHDRHLEQLRCLGVDVDLHETVEV